MSAIWLIGAILLATGVRCNPIDNAVAAGTK